MKYNPGSWCLALLMSGVALMAEEPRRVLFIGNSYTGVNKLPDIFTEIVKSSGRKVPVVKSATPGGQTLRQQLTQEPSLALMAEGNWDIVVLQGQSEEPALSEKDMKSRDHFVKSAAELCKLVREKSPKAKIYFYETWARHADFWTNEKTAKDAAAVGANPKDMQARLRKWYGQVAKDNKATVVPVGDAWELNYSSAKPIRLHRSDNSHPEFNGSYLAGLVFYGTLYGVKEPKVEWHEKLPDEEVKQLRAYAAKVLK